MDSRFSRSRKNRNDAPSGLSGARAARNSLRERKRSVESAASEIRSLRDDFRPPNLQDGDRRDREEFYQESLRVARDWAKMPLSERRDEEASLLESMRDADLIEERAGWLLDGNYGRGSYLNAREVAKKARMNKPAWFMQTLGELEWRVPRNVVIRVWKRLSPREQASLDTAILRAIRNADLE